jgi:RNA polymerase sigma factor (sigma-70 family)
MRSFTERSAETNATSRGSAQGPGDESLVEAAKRGHSMAFATLSERHRQQLFRAAHRITRSREDAEDAVQDALLRAFVHMADFDGRSSFPTWLTRIAINSALMILRKKRASLEIAVDGNDDFGADGPRHEITDHQPNPESCYAQSEEEILLKKAIQSLRPALRVVVQIQQLQECSMRETAETIGISLAAAKGRLFHAKNALRRSVIPKLNQPRFAGGFVFFPRGNGSRVAKARTRCDDQQQSNHKKEGNEYVNETKEKRNYRAPGRLHPGGDGKGFSSELGA